MRLCLTFQGRRLRDALGAAHGAARHVRRQALLVRQVAIRSRRWRVGDLSCPNGCLSILARNSHAPCFTAAARQQSLSTARNQALRSGSFINGQRRGQAALLSGWGCGRTKREHCSCRPAEVNRLAEQPRPELAGRRRPIYGTKG